MFFSCFNLVGKGIRFIFHCHGIVLTFDNAGSNFCRIADDQNSYFCKKLISLSIDFWKSFYGNLWLTSYLSSVVFDTWKRFKNFKNYLNVVFYINNVFIFLFYLFYFILYLFYYSFLFSRLDGTLNPLELFYSINAESQLATELVKKDRFVLYR